MKSGAGDRRPQGDHPYYNSQPTNRSLNLSQADMDGWTYTPPSHPAGYSSLSTAPSRPSVNANAYDNYANHVEYGAGSYNNHDDIHAAFQATQGFVDENTPEDYRNMTFQDYQQMIENHNAAVQADTPQFDDDSFGQYGSSPSTGNYVTQVTQVSGQWTGLHGLPNKSTPQRLDYPSPPPPQGSGYVYPQSPYYNSQPVHTGYDPYEYPQGPSHRPTVESPQPQPLIFIEYPSPPRTNARSGVSTTRHTASHTPTKTSRKSSPTASNKDSKTKKGYQERKTIKCDECNHKATCESNLKQHKLTHNGPKDYHCIVDGCGKSFHRPWGLGRHLKDVHNIQDAKVKKIDGVRNLPKPDGQKNIGTVSPASQKPLPPNIAPSAPGDHSSSPRYIDHLQCHPSSTSSGGEISPTGTIHCGFASPPPETPLPTPAPGPQSIAESPVLPFACPDCTLRCETSDELACHGHSFHDDPVDDQCNCSVCRGHHYQQQQLQQFQHLQHLEYIQQQQLQQQQQAQQQNGFEVHDVWAEQQQQDVDMIIEQEDKTHQAIPNPPAPAVPSTPSQDGFDICDFGPSYWFSPHHDLPHAHDSPMAHPFDTDMDMDVDDEDYTCSYPPPSPTTPWTPHAIPADAHLNINITTHEVDTEIDVKPNTSSATLDHFALNTEMGDFPADPEPFPIHYTPSLSAEEFYSKLAKMQGKEYKDDFFG
ncbi:hypothetical protein D6D01_07879 [Aureobasidium pullulans]|uniref:C2H2-type domain-containing protein n=1 Tax=Aureobasidium pullulans TaxID=5580 RepID=A0A4S9KHR3_AURPU|nr:hypothetical protein D6D01_07879 [Aureobasidium pullulans]